MNPIRALEDAVVGENGLQQQIEKEYDPTDGAAMAKIAEWGRCVIDICSRLMTQCKAYDSVSRSRYRRYENDLYYANVYAVLAASSGPSACGQSILPRILLDFHRYCSV